MNTGLKENKVSDYRVNYRRNYSIAAIIVLCLALAVRLIIFFRELEISLKTFSVVKGISGSPWVGFSNFNEILGGFAFKKVLLINTLTFNLLFSIMVFIIALVLGAIILSTPKSSMSRDILVVLCLFPLFLPDEVYTGWLINLLGSELFINPAAMRFLHPLIAAVKYAGVPILILYVLDETSTEKDSQLSLKISALFAMVSLAFISNSCYSLTKSIYNPLTYTTTDMIDTYMFRKGLMEGDYSINAASGIIQTLLSIFSFVVLFIPIKLLFSSIFENRKFILIQEKLKRNIASSGIALMIFVIIYFLPYLLNVQSFDMNIIKTQMISPIVTYLILSLISAFIAAVISSIIGWSFISPDKKIVLAAIILLSLLTLLGSKPENISEFLLVKDMRMLDTGFAIILVTCFSSASVWAMACIFRTEVNISTRNIILAAAGVLLIQAALIYCNSTPPTLYLRRPLMSPLLIFKGIRQSMPDVATINERISVNNTAGLYGFIISLPPLLLFLGAKTFLPKRQLLSIISGGMKH